MKTPSGDREVSPLARTLRENRDRRRRQAEQRHERNARVLETVRSRQGGRPA